MDSHEQFTRRWTEAQPIVAGYLNAVVPDFQEAEDLLQDVAVILLRKYSGYDPERPFVAWAIGVAKLNVLSSRRRHARNFLCYHPDLLDRIGEVCEELAPEREERSRALGECLGKVGGRAGEAVRLRYEESLRIDAVASRLEMAVVAVRVMLSRTRASLRVCIERKLKLQRLRT